MKLQDITQKVKPESHVLGIVLDQDVEYLLHTKLKVRRADLEPQEWQELIDQCNAKIIEYMKNEKIFDAIKKEASSFLVERAFRKCAVPLNGDSGHGDLVPEVKSPLLGSVDLFINRPRV